MHLKHAIIVLVLLLASCGRNSANYQQAVSNGLTSEPDVVAFNNMFSTTDHFISYYTGEYGTPRWNSKALIHGRYVLTMQFDVTIDSSGTHIKSASPLFFNLTEVTSVTPLASGQTEIRYGDGLQFGPNEWSILQQNGGDLSSLGIQVKKNQPVPNLPAHWEGA
jgi:hypothetical protein